MEGNREIRIHAVVHKVNQPTNQLCGSFIRNSKMNPLHHFPGVVIRAGAYLSSEGTNRKPHNIDRLHDPAYDLVRLGKVK